MVSNTTQRGDATGVLAVTLATQIRACVKCNWIRHGSRKVLYSCTDNAPWLPGRIATHVTTMGCMVRHNWREERGTRWVKFRRYRVRQYV